MWYCYRIDLSVYISSRYSRCILSRAQDGGTDKRFFHSPSSASTFLGAVAVTSMH